MYCRACLVHKFAIMNVIIFGDESAWCDAGTSINWSAGCSASSTALGVHEVTLSGSGRRAGAAKKGAPTPKTRSSLCKAAMFKRWLQLSPACSWCQDRVKGQCSITLEPGQTPGGKSSQELLYCNAKRCAGGGSYAQSWEALKQDASVFERWLQKPSELEEFPVASWLGT